MATMSQSEMVEFLAAPRIAHLVTLRPDGSPHVAPVWYEYVDGDFLIWTSRKFQKSKNLAGDREPPCPSPARASPIATSRWRAT